ncbi:MAG: VWA domain-containing protein [Candidatus Zixiibacteriota bacterium]|nr:MAG: VWA domain-containing protein [candidate division Zixibacteria bacterium]
MMRWGHPAVLYLLLLLPLLAALIWWAKARRGRRLREQFASAALLETVAPHLSTARQRVKDGLLLAALGLGLLALADPQVGTRMEEVKREGIDLVVAVDVSNSMLARDVAPSRLDKARHEVRGLLNLLEGDRVALVAFAGKAVVECPLTLDYGAAELFLAVLDPNLISSPGTSVAAAIRTSLQAFGEESHAGKAILLITDGEDHSGEAETAAREAREKGVIIHTVGIGSPQGVPIPQGEQGGDFRKDRQGNVVVTRLDEATLQRIAEQTGGIYQRCSTGQDELKQITAAIAGLEKGELGAKKFTQYEHRYQPILLLALILLVVEHLLSDRRMRLPGWLRVFEAERKEK